MKEILANVYFAGAGLMEIGLQRAGITVQQSFEIDPHACATQRKNFKHEVVEGDIRRQLVLKTRSAHVKLFTYPCRYYSPIAALHGRLHGEELFLHALRHMVIDPPEAFVIENVPGMRAFPVVMEAMTQLPGYYYFIQCPVQSQLWLPQRRDRLIIIGTRRAFMFRPPTARRRVRLSEIIERDPVIYIPAYVKSRLRGKYRDRPIISDPARDDIAPTCVAHYHKDLGTRMVADKRFPYGARPYTVREYARLQGVPDWFEFCGEASHAYKMIGNGVSEPVGHWIGSELCRYFRKVAA